VGKKNKACFCSDSGVFDLATSGKHLNFVLNWFPELERTFSQ